MFRIFLFFSNPFVFTKCQYLLALGYLIAVWLMIAGGSDAMLTMLTLMDHVVKLVICHFVQLNMLYLNFKPKQTLTNNCFLMSVIHRSWPSSQYCSLCCLPSPCHSTLFQNCKKLMSSVKAQTTLNWPTLRQCALPGSLWSTSFVSSLHPINGNSSKVHLTSLIC